MSSKQNMAHLVLVVISEWIIIILKQYTVVIILCIYLCSVRVSVCVSVHAYVHACAGLCPGSY